MVRLHSLSRAISFSLSPLLCTPLLVAGGPKHVAGTTYFNPGVVGQPIRRATGQITYFVDQGPPERHRHQPAGRGLGCCGRSSVERGPDGGRQHHIQGSPSPSGTLNPITVPNLEPGTAQTVNLNLADSAVGNFENAIATESQPRMLPASGMWGGRLSQVGQTDWFNFPVRGNRLLTAVTQALDEHGQPSRSKAMPAIGVWDAFAAVGTPSVAMAPMNGNAVGETWLRVQIQEDDVVRVGIADMRGDLFVVQNAKGPRSVTPSSQA